MTLQVHLLLGFLTLFIDIISGYDTVINEYVKRRVTIAGIGYLTIEHNITFRNYADYNISSYIFKIEPNVSYWRCNIWSDEGEPLKYHSVKYRHNNITRKYLQVNFNQLLLSREQMKLHIETVHILHTKPLKQFYDHDENVWFLYKGTYVFYSMYPTLEESLRIDLNDSKEIHFEGRSGFQTKKSIIFGPFKYTDSYSYKPLVIEYVPLYPLIEMESWERTIDTSSLFGHMKITEKEVLFNRGGKMKGHFNPTYKQNRPKEYSALKTHHIYLPSSTYDLQVYDELGKIHEFKILTERHYIECVIPLRYPLFNGWKTTVFISYKLKSYKYLFHANMSKFLLKMPFIYSSPTDLIQNAKINVILPSGAADIQVTYQNQTFKRVANEWIVKSFGLSPLRIIKFVGKRVLHIDSDDEFEISYNLDPQPWFIGGYISSGIAFVFLIFVLFCHSDFY